MIWYGGREGAHQPMVRMVRGATVDYIRNHLELCAAVLEPTKHYVLLTGFRGLSKLKKMGVIMTPPPLAPHLPGLPVHPLQFLHMTIHIIH
jgi:hypothetical protein